MEKLANIVALSLCAAISIITLFAHCLSRRKKTNSIKAFTILIIATIISSVVSIICEALEGVSNIDWLIFGVNLISFYSTDFIVLSFLSYVYSLLDKNKGKVTKTLHIIIFISICSETILDTILAFTGTLFIIKDGRYIEGKFNAIPYIASAIIMVEFIVLIIINRKRFTKRQFVVALIYEFLPIPFILVESYLGTGLYCLTSIGLTLSLLIVYMLIQDTTLEQNLIKQKVLEEVSKTDLLTGMQNRRSYFMKLNSINKEEKVGVIYCDINGLKKINDTLGHAEGDELIKTFSKMILSYFKDDESFRIAGDEFVIVMSNIKQEPFNKKVKTFYDAVKQHNYIAAIGASFGTLESYNKVVSEAEEKMYIDKSLHGVER